MHETIVILDFGSQYTQLIARRVREAGVYCEIHACTTPLERIRAMQPIGIILSGGPCSVYDTEAPPLHTGLLGLRYDGRPVPVLGICYGLQALAHELGGAVERAERREFGRAHLIVDDTSGLLDDVPDGATVWMSHGDHLTRLRRASAGSPTPRTRPSPPWRPRTGPSSACSSIRRSPTRPMARS
jgi:GMP synthase (glutamine-hydrolysing)